MPDNKNELRLSIIIAVVSGKDALRGCLAALIPQTDFAVDEIIVPFDEWAQDIVELTSEFPCVNFHFVEDLKLAANTKVVAHQHRLYDRRRAVGLGLARGRIVALTEDHATPAADWCEKITTAHESSAEVVGGAIENAIDAPLNRALYYADFGRYGRPLPPGEPVYVSDVNVSYKRETLAAVREIWREAYQETTVHHALRKLGIRLTLDEKIVVYQHRPPLKLSAALRERVEWGRIFAETRSREIGYAQRAAFAAGTIFLPPLLLWRIAVNMRRQKRSVGKIIGDMPLSFLLLAAWSLGELTGYLAGDPTAKQKNFNSPKLKSESFSR